MDFSPQFAKNAANAAKKRAMNRTKSLGPMSGLYSVNKYGRVNNNTERNKEGREYKINKRGIYSDPPKQISGPPMPNTWLPENGYGSSGRSFYTQAPEEQFGIFDPTTGETAYGGKRRSRKRRSRKRRSHKTKTRRINKKHK